MAFEKGRATWIWAEEPRGKNDWVLFRKEFDLDQPPGQAILRIAVDTKYTLWVNGEAVVFDGGLFRESTPGNGYYDSVEIAPLLKPGRNLLALAVWYYGNQGRNNTDSTAAGLIFECVEAGLYSDRTTQALRDPAQIETQEPHPSFLYGGHNIGHDANRAAVGFMCGEYAGPSFAPAVEIGAYGDSPWNLCLPRPIPLIRFAPVCAAPFEKNGTRYTVRLPYAMQFTPWFRIEAQGGERLDIRSDRYFVHGGPGDQHNVYRGHRTEYICRPGVQEFESLNWIFGEEIQFTLPESVRVLELGYRESRYDTDVRGVLRSPDPDLKTLAQKSIRTLLVCMRDNLMDCPDRERGQWIGDVSVQAPQIFMALDGNAVLLLKKAIRDFISLRKGDVLLGNVPGENFSELPSQSLNAISDIGMIAVYYRNTGDRELLADCLEPCVRYLQLWQTDERGLVVPRAGNWQWYDHLYNIDGPVLENAWYFSALKFARFMADELGDRRFDAFVDERISGIESVFESAFWKGSGYASGSLMDDRANAMAVLSGLADPSHYETLRTVLVSVQNATPYMEYYVLEALCQMGFRDNALLRIKARYHNLIRNGNSTLWEDFSILGTKNHAWSGGPLTILLKYFPERLRMDPLAD